MMKNIIYKLLFKHFDECEDCPLGWEERGEEDCDCGCYGSKSGDFDINIWCYMPKWIRRLKLRRVEKKIDEYWEGLYRELVHAELKWKKAYYEGEGFND